MTLRSHDLEHLGGPHSHGVGMVGHGMGDGWG